MSDPGSGKDAREGERPQEDRARLFDDGGRRPRREPVREALRGVIDPEIGLDVVTMGLIYGIVVEGSTVRIRHTLTTRGCPMEGVLRRGIAEAARSVAGVEEVQTEVVWEPPWHAGMIADDPWHEED